MHDKSAGSRNFSAYWGHYVSEVSREQSQDFHIFSQLIAFCSSLNNRGFEAGSLRFTGWCFDAKIRDHKVLFVQLKTQSTNTASGTPRKLPPSRSDPHGYHLFANRKVQAIRMMWVKRKVFEKNVTRDSAWKLALDAKCWKICSDMFRRSLKVIFNLPLLRG